MRCRVSLAIVGAWIGVGCAHQPAARDAVPRVKGTASSVHVVVEYAVDGGAAADEPFRCVAHLEPAERLRQRAALVVQDELVRARIARRSYVEGSKEAEFEVRVRVDQYDGCSNDRPQAEMTSVGAVVGGAIGGVAGGSLAGNEYAPRFGVTDLALEIVDASGERAWAGRARRRTTSGLTARPSAAWLANASLWEANDLAAKKIGRALARMERGASPYGNLGARCIPYADAEAPKDCPKFATVVVAKAELPPVVNASLQSLELPKPADATALRVADAPEGELSIVGVFADPDEATNWVQAEDLARAVTFLRTE